MKTTGTGSSSFAQIVALLLCAVFIWAFPGRLEANGSLRLSERSVWAMPLTHEKRVVNLVLEDGLLLFEVEDTFHNPNRDRVEGVYRFTLPDQAFVSGFQIMTGGKTWAPGKVMEIEKARLAYEEIVRRQTDPGLLEQHGNDLTIKVFPIEPVAPVKIRFRAHAAAPAGRKGIDLEIPVEPDRELEEEAPGGAWERAEPAAGGKRAVPRLVVAGTISDMRGIGDVSVEPAASVTAEKEGTRTFRLDLAKPPVEPVRLRVSLKTTAAPCVTGYASTDGSRFLLARIPPLAAPAGVTRGRATVVIDASGSMGGKNRARASRLVKRLANTIDINVYMWSNGVLTPAEPGSIGDHACSGPTSWNSLALPEGAGEADGMLLVTDGERLGAAQIEAIWNQGGRKPLWVALIAPEEPAGLRSALADKGGCVRLFDEQGWQAAASSLDTAMKDLCISASIAMPDGERGVPLFGRLSGSEGGEAFFVIPAASATTPVRIVDRNGAVLLELSDPGSMNDRPARGWLNLLAARQRIQSLAARPQTPEIVREITRLGLDNNLATEYTAFLAVPDDVARQFAEVLNPAFLAAFSPPSFRKAREQSRLKACYANQRVLLGAIEMYNMDNTTMMDRDPVTLGIDVEKLVKMSYLKGGLSKPEPTCDYRGGPQSILGSGTIFCVCHGYIDGEYGKTAEEQFIDACAAAGFDPLDFDIEFPPPPSPEGSPLERWLGEYRFILEVIRLFL
ncbi:MAG TPA: VIT domain-containing protein [Candidatus Ozemobacteraceae bacterium]|nr:VIT domain-containing protein [Candidatus Ozemobacteraceae bacterium]